MNNGLKWALISLPILIGGFIVYRTLRPKAPKLPSDNPLPTGGDTKPTGGGEYTPPPTPKQDFPMGLGSKGAKVKELQEAIISSGDSIAIGFLGLGGADGKFGTGTEKAVKKFLGKTKVDNQADIDKIKNFKAQKAADETRAQGKNNRIALANKQVSLFKAGKGSFYTINDVQIATGEVTSDGRDINRVVTIVGAGKKLDISKQATFKINSDGFIRAEKSISDTRMKFTEWSPNATQIK